MRVLKPGDVLYPIACPLGRVKEIIKQEYRYATVTISGVGGYTWYANVPADTRREKTDYGLRRLNKKF